MLSQAIDRKMTPLTSSKVRWEVKHKLRRREEVSQSLSDDCSRRSVNDALLNRRLALHAGHHCVPSITHRQGALLSHCPEIGSVGPRRLNTLGRHLNSENEWTRPLGNCL